MAGKKHSTLSPTLLKVLEIMPLGKAVTPTEINDHIGKGNYAAKHVLYLKILGYDFSVAKSGRNVVSYTLIKESENAAKLVADATGKTSKVKTPKAKTPKVKTVKLSTVVKKATENYVAKKTAENVAKSTKTVAEIKAANLAKLKEVGANRKKAAKRVREFDDVTETFGTTGEVGTSFNIDGDWDSVEGLDLKNLL